MHSVGRLGSRVELKISLRHFKDMGVLGNIRCDKYVGMGKEGLIKMPERLYRGSNRL